jgi:tetratricopeptide (TPR) repeat protein
LIASSGENIMLDHVNMEQTTHTARSKQREGASAMNVLVVLGLAFTLVALGFTFSLLLPPGPTNQIGLVILPLAGIGIVALSATLVPVTIAQRIQRRKREQWQVEQIIRRVVRGLPVASQAAPAAALPFWKLYPLVLLALVAGVGLLVAFYFATGYVSQAIWNGAPRWFQSALFASTLAALALAAFTIRLLRKEPRPTMRQTLRVVVKISFLLAVSACYYFVFTALSNWLSSVIANPAAVRTLLEIAPLFLFHGPMQAAFHVPRRHFIDRPLQRGDYERALRGAERLARWFPRDKGLFDQGNVLLWAGRFQEAEERLCACLAQRHSSVERVLALEHLGYAVMWQGRYEEAMRIFEAAIEIKPARRGPYSGLAEVYLRQGMNPGRALELIEYALAHWPLVRKRQTPAASARVTMPATPTSGVAGMFGLPGGVSNFADLDRFAEFGANQAWALALAGNHLDADEALKMALHRAQRKPRPQQAGIYFRAGQVLRLRADKAAAAEHFNHARQADPSGYYGGQAVRALQEIGWKAI